jgi:cell division protein FtsB
MTKTLERKVAPAPRGHRWGWVLAVILLSALALTVSGVFPFRQLIEQRRSVEATRQQLTALEQENRQLEGDIAALQTDEEVERVARDQYGLVRPGETGYVVVSPPGEVAVGDEAAPVPAVDDRPWWTRFWDWVTGNDLRRDG